MRATSHINRMELDASQMNQELIGEASLMSL